MSVPPRAEAPPGEPRETAAEHVPETTPPPEALDRRVVPLRHPWRWAATAVVLVLLAQLVHGLVANPFYQWDRFGYWVFRPVILDGLLVTLELTALAGAVGFVAALILATARLSPNPLLRSVSWFYVWLIRSIPLIVLLLFLFNLGAIYPKLSLGVPFGPEFVTFRQQDLFSYLVIGVVALALSEAAYGAEVVRAGILSVDQGQLEAAHALGLSRRRLFVRIVLPQALRSIVPSYVNQLINLIKASSLVFYVSLLDLFGAVLAMGSTYPGDIIPLLLVATFWYLVMISSISVVQFYVERYYARGAVRTLPPTPLQQVRALVADARGRLTVGRAA